MRCLLFSHTHTHMCSVRLRREVDRKEIVSLEASVRERERERKTQVHMH